jgi:soluble methane monooxygenase-binding protein MmoD
MAGILDFDRQDENALSPAPLDRDREAPFTCLGARIEIFSEGRYRAFVQDVECMWRWEIHRDDEFVQEGCSLSESSAREAVGYVISFFRRGDQRQSGQDSAKI